VARNLKASVKSVLPRLRRRLMTSLPAIIILRGVVVILPTMKGRLSTLSNLDGGHLLDLDPRCQATKPLDMLPNINVQDGIGHVQPPVKAST
jgi:hypothetical protein